MSRARRTNGPVIDIHCHRECAPAADFMKEAQLASGKVALGHGNATTRRANGLQLATIKPKVDIVVPPKSWRFPYAASRLRAAVS